MLPRKFRLHSGRDIRAALAERHKIVGGSLLVKRRENPFEHSRIAFVVSKKVSKKAAARNKIRRILSECVREHLVKLPRGVDIVVLALPGLAEKSNEDMRSALLFALRSSKLL